MAPPPSLLGPPELYRSAEQTNPQAAAGPSDAFMDLLVSNFSKGFTENMSPTFLSSGNPCLDFFFHVVPSTPPESLKERARLAWTYDPLTTLKLICNLRGVRGTGKSDKEGFFAAAFWLHENHPKTLACNLDSFADFGCFKDLPEILYRLLEGFDARKIRKEEWRNKKLRVGRSARRFPWCRPVTSKSIIKKKVRFDPVKRVKIEKEKASDLRKEKKISMAKKVLDRYSRDPDFRFLYERVSDVFAEYLNSDMEFMRIGEVKKVGLASKWCPSIDSSFDKSTLLCESIAKKMFPRMSYPEYEELEEEHYAYRVRDRLRKEVLVPLHKVLELPEVYIGANRWDSIPYNRVASVAMNFYKEKFSKHDHERFSQYLANVRDGKSTIAAGALLPHEIISSLNDDENGEVAELQWRRMVGDLLKKGKLRNCMAVCDVSGSMCGTPMEVSVAMGVLVSELSEEPWKGKVITFSESPELQKVEGENLKQKTEFVRRMDWGMNTDFQSVFDLILEVAVRGELKEEEIIKRVFVFSDMEFDQASASSWETDYEVILRKFSEKGYGACVPQIVFWNLRNSRGTPVDRSQKGVALVSGYSKNLMKLFLDEDGEVSPEAVMVAAWGRVSEISCSRLNFFIFLPK